MKISRLFLSLLAISLLTCLTGVQGQYQYPTTSTSTTPTSMASTPTASTPIPIQASQYESQYAEYYSTTPGIVPNNTISAPMPLTLGSTPSTVYIGTQMQAVPYAQYQGTASQSTGPSLWVQGTTNWTQYAVVPLGSTVQLLAISPNGGNGYITDNEPSSLQYSQFFYFYPRSQMPFYADQVGQHVLTFSVGNQISNPVTVEVTGYYYPGYYRGYRNNYGYYSNYYGNYRMYGNYYGNYGGYGGVGNYNSYGY